MASTYTDILRLELPTVGELDGTWGTRVNVGITALVESAIAGTATVTHDDTANYSLTTVSGAADEARKMFLNITGALGAARNVVCPTKSKLYFVRNATTGGFAVTLKTSGGTGISVPNGKYMMLYCDGTNVVEATNYSSSGVNLSGTNTWTGAQTFTNSLMKLLGSSTGLTVFASANASGTDYTITFPASTGTVLTTATAVTPAQGGTGVANGANNTITFTGNYTLGATLTGNTAVTFPTSGTLAATTQLYAGGLQTCWIPAGAMTTRTTNGAASGTVEMATTYNMFKTLDFDTATAEYSQFTIQMPKSWNEGTVTAAFVWSHAATTTNFGVAFGLQGVAISNDDTGAVAFGTGVLAVDTGGTTNDIYISPTTSAITIAGTPAANDYVMFQVYRAVSDAGDTMAIDARLHGIQLFYSTDAATDA